MRIIIVLFANVVAWSPLSSSMTAHLKNSTRARGPDLSHSKRYGKSDRDDSRVI